MSVKKDTCWVLACAVWGSGGDHHHGARRLLDAMAGVVRVRCLGYFWLLYGKGHLKAGNLSAVLASGSAGAGDPDLVS